MPHQKMEAEMKFLALWIIYIYSSLCKLLVSLAVDLVKCIKWKYRSF